MKQTKLLIIFLLLLLVIGFFTLLTVKYISKYTNPKKLVQSTSFIADKENIKNKENQNTKTIYGYILGIGGLNEIEWVAIDEIEFLQDFSNEGIDTQNATKAMIADGMVDENNCKYACAPNGYYIRNKDKNPSQYNIADQDITVVMYSNRENQNQSYKLNEWAQIFNQEGMGKKNRDSSPFFIYPYRLFLSNEDNSIIKIEQIYLP